MREGDKRNPTSPARCLLDKADFLYTYNSVSNLLFTCTCVPDKRFEYSPKTDEGSGRTHSSAHATWGVCIGGRVYSCLLTRTVLAGQHCRR